MPEALTFKINSLDLLFIEKWFTGLKIRKMALDIP